MRIALNQMNIDQEINDILKILENYPTDEFTIAYANNLLAIKSLEVQIKLSLSKSLLHYHQKTKYDIDENDTVTYLTDDEEKHFLSLGDNEKFNILKTMAVKCDSKFIFNLNNFDSWFKYLKFVITMEVLADKEDTYHHMIFPKIFGKIFAFAIFDKLQYAKPKCYNNIGITEEISDELSITLTQKIYNKLKLIENLFAEIHNKTFCKQYGQFTNIWNKPKLLINSETKEIPEKKYYLRVKTYKPDSALKIEIMYFDKTSKYGHCNDIKPAFGSGQIIINPTWRTTKIDPFYNLCKDTNFDFIDNENTRSELLKSLQNVMKPYFVHGLCFSLRGIKICSPDYRAFDFEQFE